LLQQRSLNKYHTPGLWTNTCCSHQRPGEETLSAAHRRLVEEMGFDCPLQEAYEFVYKVPFKNGLWEHEFDHVLIGRYDGAVTPNTEEVNAYRWITIDELKQDMKDNPHHYTPWFHIILDEHYDSIVAKIKNINFK
jgi:isopentenyl-diphosphate delta-isomerase